MKLNISAFKQNLNLAQQSFKSHFLKNKALYITFFSVMLFCLVCAIICTCQNSAGITIINCSDNNLIAYLCGKGTFTNLLFLWFFHFLFVVLLILLMVNIKSLLPLIYLLLAYEMFVAFLNGCIFIVVYGLIGILFSVSIIFLGAILLNTILFIIAVNCLKNNLCSCNCKNRLLNYPLKLIGLLILLAFVVIILQAVLTKIFSPIIIIII